MIVIDTDVVIDFLRGDKAVVDYVEKIEKELAITSITLSELYYGASKAQQMGKHRKQIGSLIEFVRVLHTSHESSRIFGETKAKLENQGKIVDDMDLLIASIVEAYEYQFVTGNISHFERIDGLEAYSIGQVI